MKGSRLRSVLMTCTAMASLCVAAPAFAQDGAAGGSTVLDTIEVKGRKAAAAAASDTPLATQTTGEEIARKEIDSIADLGNTTEVGVDFIATRPGEAGGIFIRGMTGPRIATQIDGIPIPFLENSARNSVGSPTTSGATGGADSFDFSSLSALDVMRGADSSRIGSGALGGALVLRTLEPDDLIAPGRDWGALSKVTYDSEDSSISGSLAAARRFGNTAFLLQGAWKRGEERRNKGDLDILGTARTEPNPVEFDQTNLLFKLRHDVQGGHTIGVTGERFNLDSDIDFRTLQTETGGATTYGPGQRWGFEDTLRERISLDYNFVSPESGSLVDAAGLVLYWQRLQKAAGHDGWSRGDVRHMRDNMLEESTFGLSGNAISGQFDTGALTHQFRAGGNLSFFTTEHYISAFPVSAGQADIPKVDGARVGIYVDDRISFGDSGFDLTPGLRFDWHQYRPKATSEYIDENIGSGYFGLGEENSGARLSPKLLATYQATPDVELFAQWSMAYRAPTVDELYLNFTNIFVIPGMGSMGYAVLGNPDLKPETGHGFEIGANVGNEALGGRVTLFHNRYRNFIDTEQVDPALVPPDMTEGVTRYVNLERVRVSGVELSAHKRFDSGVRVHGSLAYSYGKDVSTGAVLRSVAPFKAIVGVGYEQETWGVDLTGIFAGRMRDDGDADTFDAPGYGIANLTAWWEPAQTNGLRLQAGVYNIFDETYYNALRVRNINPNGVSTSNQPVEFYSEPGRTFRVSLTHKF